jgi:hypothetical protein
MGIGKWFKRKVNKPAQGSEDDSIEALEAFSNKRDEVYTKLFGKAENVSHELAVMFPHIDVYIYPPRRSGRPFYTLVTGGMSDIPMQLPEDADRSYARREIILYCEKPDDDLIGLVRYFAHYPFDYATWLGDGHTVPNGSKYEPIFENSALCGALFIDTILVSDRNLGAKLAFQGEPVEFLWLVPITKAEMSLAEKKGTTALLDVFEARHHPLVLDKRRVSYV